MAEYSADHICSLLRRLSAFITKPSKDYVTFIWQSIYAAILLFDWIAQREDFRLFIR
jgi:hypothetical protein